MSSHVIFGITDYHSMAEEIGQLTGHRLGEIELRHFPDGEIYQRILTPVGDAEITIVGGTASDRHTLELYDLACAVLKYGTFRLNLFIPYFGYSTMERAVYPGEVVKAKTRARLFSSVPATGQSIRIFFLDLHAEGIPHYLEGGVTAFHVYGKPFVREAARRIGKKDFVLASTDAGRAKWVQSLAEDLGVDASFVFKRRLDEKQTAIRAVDAHVKDRPVIIYDDMIRTGGSLKQAAHAYLEAGAASVSVIATHAVLPGDAFSDLLASHLFDSIHTTNSHPQASRISSLAYHVHSVAPLFVNALENHPWKLSE